MLIIFSQTFWNNFDLTNFSQKSKKSKNLNQLSLIVSVTVSLFKISMPRLFSIKMSKRSNGGTRRVFHYEINSKTSKNASNFEFQGLKFKKNNSQIFPLPSKYQGLCQHGCRGCLVPAEILNITPCSLAPVYFEVLVLSTT